MQNTNGGLCRFSIPLIVVLAAACGGGSSEAPAPAPVVNPVDPEIVGVISGRIAFDGNAPAPTPIKTSSDPNCAGTPMTESLLVNASGGLQNVFVYVKDGLGNRVFPVPTTPVVLDQKGCTYVPHVFGAQVGQPIEIVSSDPTLHNVHAQARANQEFNRGFPQQGMKMTHTFTTKEVLVPIKCDVHGWMRSYAGIVDHPFFAVSATDGSFALQGVPPGTYTIEAVHETLGAQAQSVTVGEKETKEIAFSFKQ